MRPVTLTTPKPLIRVKGVRMIDTVIQALHENGIYEIYVVVGYRKEQFACLTAEYKGVTLIENPYWDSCNNIASLYVAREQLENAMILDGDQIIYKKEILAPEFTWNWNLKKNRTVRFTGTMWQCSVIFKSMSLASTRCRKVT